MGNAEPLSKLGGVIGLGLAYAGSCREDFIEILSDIVIDQKPSVELSAYAALSLGLIFTGSCNDEVAMVILQSLMERPES